MKQDISYIVYVADLIPLELLEPQFRNQGCRLFLSFIALIENGNSFYQGGLMKARWFLLSQEIAMKAFVALSLVLLLSGAANAGFLDELRSTFKSISGTFSNVLHQVTPIISEAAGHLVDGLKTTGSQLLSKGAQALLGSLGGGGTGTTNAPATRNTDLMQQLQQFVSKGKDTIHNVLDTVKGLFQNALTRLGEVAKKFHLQDLTHLSLASLISDIEGIVSSHGILQGTIMKELAEKPAQLLTDAAQHIIGALSHHKRGAVVDQLKTIGSQIAGQFTPFISTVTQHIANIGNALKNVGSTLLGAIKPSIDALKGKLSTHIDTLKNAGTTLLGHGKNAISALTDAVTDILGQTFKNAQPTIQKAVETAKNAGSVALNHLTSALTGGN
ncbi:hypothetical protein LOTGIDRAFT_232950 [Lottia gigantea]|uniref:Uncharacterized protein n=1 Tax=Lottia gigantea TaxID=225164 RepID=V4ACQ8_LOTGI|nr:hypothetical protein LOTGIDRAFT_232950 [Lottia gigantea]ESO92860.1 hypothetical protein LOTGIDRAFT_232950 [Lottia gigantea]